MKLAAFVIGCAVGWGSQESPSRVEVAATRFLESWSDGDSQVMREVANAVRPDAWVVADHLLRVEQKDAALALASAAPKAISEPLRAYLEAGPTPSPSLECDLALDRFERARSAADRSAVAATLEEWRATPSPVLRVRIENALGQVLREQLDYEASLSAYAVAVSVARELSWRAAEAEALRATGLVARRLPGGLERALDAWSRATELESELGESAGFALSSFYLGNALGESGRFRRSGEALEAARAAFARVGDARRESWALQSLGTVHQRLGELGRALEAFERAHELASQANDGRQVATIELELAGIHGWLGDPDRSMELANRALGIFEGRDTLRTARAEGTLGLAYERKGLYEEALEHLQRSRELHEEVGDVRGRIASLTNIALVQMQLGQLDRAEEDQRRALVLARELGDVWAEAGANFHLSRILRGQERYEAARTCDAELIRIGESLEAPRLLLRGHLNSAKGLLDQGRHEEAIAAARRAVEFTRHSVNGLAPEEHARARDHRAEVFAVGIRAALGAEDPVALFEMIESGRARALVDSLGGREHLAKVVVPADLGAAHRRAEDAELEALLRLRECLRSADEDEARIAREALSSARGEVRAAVQRIQRNARIGADLAFQEPMSLATFRAQMQPDEALVLYALIDPAAVALVVTREGARIVSLGAPDRIVNQCLVLQTNSRTTRGLRAPSREPATNTDQLVADLHGQLIAPLKLGETVRRLLIVPDGSLAYVPFVLLAPDVEVVYAPSATTYDLLTSKEASQGTEVLAVGDPVHGELSPLPPLPGSRDEALAVGDHRLLAEEATKRGLAAALGRAEPWRSVHIACHALIDPVEPLENQLCLTPREGDDGRLTVLDVLGLSVRTDLVVLSACETGIGKLYRTEGVFGFTRAFLGAGAPSVVVSLWRVDDSATKALMTRLYELWNPEEGDGLPLATALREAQAWVRSQEPWREPHYWAAWQVWGLPD